MPSTTQLAVLDDLKQAFGVSVLEVTEHVADVFVLVSRDAIIPVLTRLKETHRFIYLADLFGVDRFTTADRFEVVYNLVSLATGTRLFVKTRVPEDDPVLPSAIGIWSGANWNEREVYDMFGVRFEGHPDPRRIFMPEDFEYFPLRKEFPLLGIPGSIELPNTTPDPENT